MFSVRTTKTSSFATAVQVVRYFRRRTIVVKHIGSSRRKEEVNLLKKIARDWMEENTSQLNLFPNKGKERQPAISKVYQYLGCRLNLFYETIDKIFKLFAFDKIANRLFLDLVLARISEPSSKSRSFEIIKDDFGTVYQRGEFYDNLPVFIFLKESIEEKVITFAKKFLRFNFSVIFYDVTTLYFETFINDDDDKTNGNNIENGNTGNGREKTEVNDKNEAPFTKSEIDKIKDSLNMWKGERKARDSLLRKCGYSKDNKFNQPQILIGLVVNDQGFPVSYEIFAGNKFEGHTILPAVLRLKEKYRVDNLTVVADAAMLSFENIKSLLQENLNYIVGARMGNLNGKTIKAISGCLKREDEKTIRLKTEKGFLICAFSQKRFNKDKYEMEKQIKKAQEALKNPSSIARRHKFVKKIKSKKSFEFNQELLEKTKLLLGIKGYYTNLCEKSDKIVIDHYRNLWQVEKSFRIAKSDLQIRPVYLWTVESIYVHILICFMSLAVCKYIEIKTGFATKKTVKLLKRVTDALMVNKITNEKIFMRSPINETTKHFLELLDLSY